MPLILSVLNKIMNIGSNSIRKVYKAKIKKSEFLKKESPKAKIKPEKYQWKGARF